jgi:glycosyltransferase involved in cell wall biosynthesis
LDEQRPTCVCLNGYATPLALGALLWCIDHRVPAVMMSESAANDETRKGWKEWIKSRVIRLCSSALVGGSPHAEYMARLGLPHERIFLGYDAVDNDYFTLGAQKARADAAKLRLSHHLPPNYFMASARFVPKKNLPRLLEAFAHYLRLVPAGHEPWSLVLLGDGAERDALLKLRQNLGLEKAVHLVGAKSYKELPIYYGLASAFVHASTTEQWGLVVNEAMASGLPVLVSSRCGSTPDLVHDGINGFLFAPLDVEDLARKMLNLTQSRDRLSTYGLASQNIIADWSPARFARGLTQAIEIAQTNTLPRPTWLDRLLLSILIHQ